ncbi:hypothetical protein [Kitasatospora sp. NPDC127116]
MAGSASADARAVELVFALLLSGCAVGALLLLGGAGSKDRGGRR